MSTDTSNSLAESSSAYLRSAAQQPVLWHEWSAEAFALAQKEDKPILLDIGAVWCHWCHVMDRESYENAATAEIINRHFVAIKVDRDERPDVDTRYQAAVSAISGQGGWPLTAFLTPDGRPFFGGTYFPPEDRYGRPSFQRVLQTMSEAFRDRRDEVNDSAGSIVQAIEFNESFSGRSGDLGAVLIEKLAESMLRQFDPQNGGFGSQPKFPHTAALDFLIDLASRPGAQAARARNAAIVTLKKMAAGGIRDQLGGGFHRYSVDERWIVPHFEKMAYDNAELLRNYVHGFQSFVDPEFGHVARAIMRWMDECLTDRKNGGFYGSQDADVDLDDDGNFFTWTRDEAAGVLSKEELAVAELFFDIGEIGDMHHDPSRNVLRVLYPLDEVARRLKMETAQAKLLLRSAAGKMRVARTQRPTPFIDKTLYTGWNGLCISAYLEAGRALMEHDAIDFALCSLDRALATAWSKEGLKHIISYGKSGFSSAPGVLEDYTYLALACIDAFEATAERKYLDAAVELAEYLIEHFQDKTGGGFFDTSQSVEGHLGVLSARRKPLQDAPTPAGNPSAALMLLRLADWTGREDLRNAAIGTLEAFAGIVEHFGLYAATFGIALQRLLHPPVQVVVLGEDALANELEATAMARFAINKSVLRVAPGQRDSLPDGLRETLSALPADKTIATICGDGRCLPPVSQPEALIVSLNEAL